MSTFATPRVLSNTLTPFLYPCLDSTWTSSIFPRRLAAGRWRSPHTRLYLSERHQSTAAAPATPFPANDPPNPRIDVNQYDHLDPQPLDYSSNPFTDSCTLTLHAGAGGHGCISFLREKFIAHGPPNGGDGGTGGNVYIQAVQGETSLHKLARRGILKAARGRNGEGGNRGGKRGEDILLQVPVGTVVREIGRVDPVEEEEKLAREERRARKVGFGHDAQEDEVEDMETTNRRKWRRDKWLLYPGALPKSFSTADFPPLPRPRKNNLVASQPAAPLRLDLDEPMSTPMLLAAGAMGGLGNPHFVTKSIPRPKFATKGDEGTRIQVQLELKLLADVGLVGLPNAGKSTLLRALTRSRTRVGSWAFTTLSPNIGTVVLDSHVGRPIRPANGANGEPRSHFTIADIPGLIEDAHLDHGLGLGFLRHIERAGVLAFVVDLSAGDAVSALKALWREVGEYEGMRERELNAETERPVQGEEALTSYQPFASSISPAVDPEPFGETIVLDPKPNRDMTPLSSPSAISSKPWFVVATKADLADTEENFTGLREYLARIERGEEEHPSTKPNAWRKRIYSVPVSAMRKEGVEGVVEAMVNLLR